MLQCPKCNEVVQYLTENHCRTKHNMTRKQLIKKYGKPIYKPDMRTREINAWLQRESYIIQESQFGYAQAAVKSVQKR